MASQWAYSIGQAISGPGGANAAYTGNGNVKLANGNTVSVANYLAFGANADSIVAMLANPNVLYNSAGSQLGSSNAGQQWSAGKWNAQGNWIPDTSATDAALLAKAYGLNAALMVNPGLANPGSGAWNPSFITNGQTTMPSPNSNNDAGSPTQIFHGNDPVANGQFIGPPAPHSGYNPDIGFIIHRHGTDPVAAGKFTGLYRYAKHAPKQPPVYQTHSSAGNDHFMFGSTSDFYNHVASPRFRP